MAFCNSQTLNCATCYETSVADCGDTLYFLLGLTPSTTYYITLINKFDAEDEQTIETDINGDFTITQDWLKYNGAVEMKIYSDENRENIVTFTISTIDYNCLIIK